MRKINKLCAYLLALGITLVIVVAYLHFKDGAPLQISLATACDGKGECRDPVALLEGPINLRSESKTTSDLLDFIKSHPEVDTVCLVSEGGDVDTSVALGRFIHRKGLKTCIANKYKKADGSERKGYCQSSCVWVSISGNESILYDNSALLGFHAARVQDLFGNVKRIDSEGLLKFAGLIKEVARDTAEQNRLYGLLLWSFDQGTTTDTTDCSAQQVQEHYPYFSKVKDINNGTYAVCELR
ncbi:hypothetical protein [Pseudomonas sp. NBRC 111139]|uniref:hypothetical protein n=1 Tax=Pseudomonas sp. NBRC 111139 TaxID=1661054 RepID=UPI001112D086|nr:hypothetical protein [Pseudomonas sp. NBRC 111139]